jgi:GT2 family glycosyltransferase
MSTTPQVAVVVVHWGAVEMTRTCVESVQRSRYANVAVILVDNCPGNRFADDFLGDNYNYHYIRNKENSGFAGGNNIGLRKAQQIEAEYVLLLNNDAVLDEYFIGICTSYLEAHPDVAAVSPKILYYYAPDYINAAGGVMNMNTGETILIGENTKETGQFNAQREITFATGCVFFVRLSVFSEIGLFDESLFCYCEDDDLSRRIISKGYKMWYLPEAKAFHKHRNVCAESSRGIKGSQVYYYWRNHFYNLRRYLSRNHLAEYARFFWRFFWSFVSFSLKHRRPDLSFMMLLGLIDSVCGRMGKRDYHLVQRVCKPMGACYKF